MTSPSSTDPYNIFIAGLWNPAIFSPAWAKEYLAEDETGDVVFAIPAGQFSANFPPRLTIDGVNLYPSAQGLSMGCVDYNDASIDMCSKKLTKLSGLLPHTPVSAIGVNFRFMGSLTDSDVLTELFTFSDAGKIAAEKYKLSGAQITRTFDIDTSTKLNLTIGALSQDMTIEFNFHSDTKSLSEAASKVTSNQIVEWKNNAIQFLTDTYGVDLET